MQGGSCLLLEVSIDVSSQCILALFFKSGIRNETYSRSIIQHNLKIKKIIVVGVSYNKIVQKKVSLLWGYYLAI